MLWFVHRIIKIKKEHHHVLPTVECILKAGKDKITAVGWLPCHHSNVRYTLTLKTTNGVHHIVSIENMEKRKKKSTIPKSRSPNYITMAEDSYNDVALWTVSVMYPILDILKMNIDTVFQRLTTNIENVCLRDSPHAIHLYNIPEAKKVIQAGLRQMGEVPYNNWEGFEARMKWQEETRYNTASLKKPLGTIYNLECYQNRWTSTQDLEHAATIAAAMTPHNTSLVLGSFSSSFVPRNAFILVRNTEDAYRVQCQLEWGYANIYMLHMNMTYRVTPQQLHNNTPASLGLYLVKELPQDLPHLFVAWSHLWGVEEWLTVLAKNPTRYTCVGRLDQVTAGRGQIFRDMVDSQKFPIINTTHVRTDNLIMVNTDDISEFVTAVTAKHGTVQCFADKKTVEQFSPVIDSNRRQLYNPIRIRSLRDQTETPGIRLPRVPLYEEYFTNNKCTHINKSIVPIRSFNGVHVHAAIYICSKYTTPFEIHVARTHAREALYIVNCQTCMFALDKKCKKRRTISLF